MRIAYKMGKNKKLALQEISSIQMEYT